ncbi:GreA/GreB family elongation factor [Sulfidibacter corallicola]|uniref:GreA/GreB family elongation factor n=1 Tax=Sulfidibacter corallicola TaxID=2818388 RepID=A0A8A4TJC9_SULCO|nr:hypothetical protein [Sulfidibacter corallicola]QTD49703.1 GreA/GreB family elongation factor [Sulfidibacter corallicola]
MEKQAILSAIVTHFENEYQVLAKAAMATYEAATHEENRAENKYDTRGLEASYLAESQSKRARELQQTANRYRGMKPVRFGEDDPIGQGALVTLKSEQGEAAYFLGPAGGGARIRFGDIGFVIVTGASPLGSALIGKEVGDLVILESGGNEREYEITGVT